MYAGEVVEEGGDPRSLPPARAPLHAGAARVRPGARSRPDAAPGDHPGRGAGPDPAAAGLRVRARAAPRALGALPADLAPRWTATGERPSRPLPPARPSGAERPAAGGRGISRVRFRRAGPARRLAAGRRARGPSARGRFAGASLDDPGGDHLRAGRRERLGQDHARPRDHRVSSPPRRARSRFEGDRAARPLRAGAQRSGARSR